MSEDRKETLEEISWRCIVDSSEVDISQPGKMKFTYTDYEKLQTLIIQALDTEQKRANAIDQSFEHFRNEHICQDKIKELEAEVERLKDKGETSDWAGQKPEAQAIKINELQAKLAEEKKGNDRLKSCPTILLDTLLKLSDATKALNGLLFCAERVKSATFRAIDRKQFDESIEQANKTVIEIAKKRVKNDETS